MVKLQMDLEKFLKQNSDLTQIAYEVIENRWSWGEERKQKLEAAGYNYWIIQGIVNAILYK